MQSTETVSGDTNETLTKLNMLILESKQLYELEDQKLNIINDLYNSLKIITEFLNFSVNIEPKIFNLPDDTTVSLLPNLDIIFRASNGKTEIAKINSYSPEIITHILEYVIPKILELIKNQKLYLVDKINFLQSVTTQLSQLNNLQSDAPIQNSNGESNNE